MVRLDGRGNRRESIGPVDATARNEPAAFAVADREHAIAVVLDLVQPIGTGWREGCRGREAGLDGSHRAVLTSRLGQNAASRSQGFRSIL
jgi:hypothetical protein